MGAANACGPLFAARIHLPTILLDGDLRSRHRQPNPFGVSGVRERKPQGCCCDADQEFGHRQPPLRPRGQPRLRPAVSIAERRFGSVLNARAAETLSGPTPAHKSTKSMY